MRVLHVAEYIAAPSSEKPASTNSPALERAERGNEPRRPSAYRAGGSGTIRQVH